MASRKRTKEELARDASFILRAPVHELTKYAVLNNVLWKWTEYAGKYKGCKFWTQAALEHYSIRKSKGLRHEHVVPRKYLINMLLILDCPTAEVVFDILEKFAIGAIVTKDEEKELNKHFKEDMPEDFIDLSSTAFHDPWLRFKHIDLNVLEH